MRIRLIVGVAATATGAWFLRPDAAACRELLGPGFAAAIERDGADATLSTLGGAALWLCALWLLLALAIEGAAAAPGGLGRRADRVARAIAPASIRRVLALILGATIVASPALAAGAEEGPAANPPGIPAPGWPISAPTWPTSPGAPIPGTQAPGTPAPDAPAPDAPAAASPPDPPAGAPASGGDSAAGDVAVEAGDSLWSIAAAHLPPGASAADIAAAWPAWHQANADAIGADPNLIRPGQLLRAPSDGAGSTGPGAADPADAAAPAADAR